jgi:tetratricopeptide (TPR) repeat protein
MGNVSRYLQWAVLAVGMAISPEAVFGGEASESLIQQGLDLRRAGRDVDALEKFERAYSMEPSPRAAAQVGLCLQAVGRLADADAKLSEALSSPNDPWVKKNLAILKASSEEAKSHVARIEIVGTPTGSEVFLTGRSIGRLPLSKPIAVDEGTVVLEFRASGFATQTRQVNIRGGQYQKLLVRLEELPLVSQLSPPQTVSSDLTQSESKPMDSSVETPSAFYKTGWFWGGVAAAAAGVLVASLVLMSKDSTTLGPIPADRKDTF